jgi:signal transduction histidine kinase
MVHAVPKIVRRNEWNRIKGDHPRGCIVDAVAVRHEGFGAICEVGAKRYAAILRSREISWDPSEQKPESIALGVPFRAVVIGYDEEWRELKLSRKAAEKGPFEKFVAHHREGEVVEGTVEKVVPDGYVLRLEGHIEAHLDKRALPNMAGRPGQNVAAIGELRVGDQVRAIVAKMSRKTERINLDVRSFLTRRAAELRERAKEIRQKQIRQPTFGSPLSSDDEPPSEMPHGLATRKLAVLLVEDFWGIRSPVSWTLQRRGHEVIACRSAKEARQTFSENGNIDVALIDLQLGGEFGQAICSEVRQRFPQARVYAFTGNPDALTNQVPRPPDDLVDGVILKPVDLGTVTAYVEGRLRPPATQRIWALDEVLQSFVGRERLGVKEAADAKQNAFLDAHLKDIVETVPGAKAAVLSFQKETRQVSCLRSLNVEPELFAPFSRLLAFTPMAEVLREGKSLMRRVNLVWVQENSTLRELMNRIQSELLIGFPLHVESRRDALGLFVFGPKDVPYIDKEAIASCEAVAASLAVAIERSLIDVELVRHQRAICVGSLILGMAHELRNSLQSLDSYTCVLEATLESGRKAGSDKASDPRSVLADVRKQVVVLKENLETFLGIARVDQAGHQRLDEMLLEVVASAQAAARQEDIVVDLQIPGDSSFPIVPRIARQAFLNLLLNAIQHTAVTGDRGGVVEITMHEGADGEDGSRFVEVRFTDNASGIHATDCEQVFEMFFTTRKHGSGLGLYVTRLIIQGLGGEVKVAETAILAGTTFLVRLPVLRKKESKCDDCGSIHPSDDKDSGR